MNYQVAWYILIALLLIGYVVLDGFDLGVGILHLFTKEEDQRRVQLQAIGPVWDGNEVWLVTAGGALFAAFPPVYAAAASGAYSALTLLLLMLIGRAAALEFRGKLDRPAWRRLWDTIFGLSSLGAAVMLGAVFGNILRGLPLDGAGGFQGRFWDLLTPFPLLVGAAGAAFCALHGAAYLKIKTAGAIRGRITAWIPGLWRLWAVSAALAGAGAIVAAPHLFEGWAWSGLVGAAAAGAAFIAVPFLNLGRRDGAVFLATSVMIIGVLGFLARAMFPVMLYSTLGPDRHLTAFNASSSELTLRVMFIIAAVGVPVVLAYTAWVYWSFRGKVLPHEADHY